MRKSDRQLAAGIYIAKQHFCGRRAAFFTQIPTFEDRGNVLCDVVDRKWPAIDKQHDSWRSCFNYLSDQLALCSEQIERIAITTVLFRPSLAICALVFADHQNCNVSA